MVYTQAIRMKYCFRRNRKYEFFVERQIIVCAMCDVRIRLCVVFFFSQRCALVTLSRAHVNAFPDEEKDKGKEEKKKQIKKRVERLKCTAIE